MEQRSPSAECVADRHHMELRRPRREGPHRHRDGRGRGRRRQADRRARCSREGRASDQGGHILCHRANIWLERRTARCCWPRGQAISVLTTAFRLRRKPQARCSCSSEFRQRFVARWLLHSMSHLPGRARVRQRTGAKIQTGRNCWFSGRAGWRQSVPQTHQDHAMPDLGEDPRRHRVDGAPQSLATLLGSHGLIEAILA